MVSLARISYSSDHENQLVKDGNENVKSLDFCFP